MALLGNKKPDEAELLKEIRDLYSRYIVEYEKTPRVSRGFEDRYLQALRDRKDLNTFFAVEKSFIEGQIDKADEERRDQWNERVEEIQHQDDESYGDRMIRQLEERMVQYPPVDVHPDAMEDIERLLGAVKIILDQWWSVLAGAIRSHNDYTLRQEFRSLDDALYRLTGSNKDLPRAVRDYEMLLSREAPGRELNQAVRTFFLEAGEFLHTLKNLLGVLKVQTQGLSADELEKVEEMYQMVTDVIKNFRLQDIGR